jgi:cobyrinic acid a,c-diamide synthase
LNLSVPRLVVAGATSNVGKTTVTAGLIASLRQRGLTVQPFKCGPDYVDPSYHERAAGRPCRNLDTWMLNDTQLVESFERACKDADIAVVEGVMGLFDGADWHAERGSTAQIAKLLNAPVLLVLDISGAARSAAAMALGYRHFDTALTLCGVALNFAGSERHAQGCGEAIERATGLPMLGWLPREPGLQIPERHLGLVPGGEQEDSAALIAKLGSAVAAGFDLTRILDIARGRGGEGAGGVEVRTRVEARARTRKSRPILAVARDEAFCFYYPENLELLIEAGATIQFFSPLRGECPDAHAAGVYLGGGYPELHGPALASNTNLWSALKELHAADAPIFAECGGFMVLTQELTDAEGRTWQMGGLLPGATRMSGKLAALGYRTATALRSNLLAERGETLRGHEFRYSSWDHETRPEDATTAWEIRGARVDAPVGFVGYAQGNLLASYLHVHFGQRPELARRFTECLRKRGS